jgi:hypothetical protein
MKNLTIRDATLIAFFLMICFFALAGCENIGDGTFDAQEQDIVQAILDSLREARENGS